MFNDEGLGAAMALSANEDRARRALEECAALRERVLLLERTLTTVLNTLSARGIRASDGTTEA